MIYDVIVIGGGASGLFFAANYLGPGALAKPFRGLVLEGTNRVGTKLLMSGGGHCNITHSGSIKDFINCYGENGKLIRKMLYRHSNLELIKWLESNGIPTITESDGRVFPASKKASDVLDLLLRKASEHGFEIQTNSKVVSIDRYTISGQAADGDGLERHTVDVDAPDNSAFWRIGVDKKTKDARTEYYLTKRIVIATGGCSYPKTGSDGSMFDVLRRDLGLPINELRPALTPITVADYPYSDIAGVTLTAEIKVVKSQSGFRKHSSVGQLLFTHKDLSGPAAINISGALDPGDSISINYLHPMKYDEAFSRLQTATIGNKAEYANIIAKTFDLPKSFSEIVSARSNGSTKAAAHILTEDEFTVSSCGNFYNAMVTKGGVSLDEIDLATMELKIHRGIYIIGEALDINGETGGYNLQFAYSSALTCSKSSNLVDGGADCD